MEEKAITEVREEKLPALPPEQPLAPETLPPLALAKRITKAMSTLRPLILDGYVPQLHYRYPTIAQVREKANEALAQAGIALIPSVVKVGRGVRQGEGGKQIAVTAVELEIAIVSDDGSYKVRWVGESQDVSDKGIPKAISAAIKSFLATFLLAPVAEEEETAPAEVQAPQPQPQPQQATSHWIDDPQLRKKFWGIVRGNLKLTPEKAHELLGVEHMRDYKGTLEQALTELSEKLYEERKKSSPPLSEEEKKQIREMVWGGEP
jgi:hypothetical protein